MAIECVASWNVNGLRAALRKDFLPWVQAHRPQVLALQEIKIDADSLRALADPLPGYRFAWFPAQKKGYSGVAIGWSGPDPLHIELGSGHPQYDAEGRVLLAAWEDLAVLNVYLPSGSQGEERQEVKEAFMAWFLEWLGPVRQRWERLLIVGDFNICHEAIDIHDPVRLKTVSGFLPHERAWFTRLLQTGLTDTFRHLNPNAQEYTWYSYRAASKERNKGWRIDYQLASPALLPRLQHSRIDQAPAASDHQPLVVQLSA